MATGTSNAATIFVVTNLEPFTIMYGDGKSTATQLASLSLLGTANGTTAPALY